MCSWTGNVYPQHLVAWYRIDKIILISVLIYRSIHEVIKPPDYILRLTLDHGYMLVVPNQNHALLWACSC